MTDSAMSMRHDDLPLSDDQLGQIAGGGPRRGGGKNDSGTISISIVCDKCGVSVTDISAHQAAGCSV